MKMKSLIVLVVICCAIDISEAMSKEQRRELFLQMANECAKKEGGSPEDVAELADHKPASGHSGKCVRACLAETTGIMKDNKADIDGTVNIATMAYDGDEAKVKIARSLAEACTAATDADRCEAAAKIFQCGRDTAKSLGLSFDDL